MNHMSHTSTREVKAANCNLAWRPSFLTVYIPAVSGLCALLFPPFEIWKKELFWIVIGSAAFWGLLQKPFQFISSSRLLCRGFRNVACCWISSCCTMWPIQQHSDSKSLEIWRFDQRCGWVSVASDIIQCQIPLKISILSHYLTNLAVIISKTRCNEVKW